MFSLKNTSSKFFGFPVFSLTPVVLQSCIIRLRVEALSKVCACANRNTATVLQEHQLALRHVEHVLELNRLDQKIHRCKQFGIGQNRNV